MLGEASAIAAAGGWAASSIILKSLTPHFRPVWLNSLRCSFSSLFLVAVLLGMGKTEEVGRLPGVTLGTFIASALIGMALAENLYLASLRYLDVSIAYPISMAVWPLTTYAIAALFLDERITALMLLGTGVVLVGLYLLASPTKERNSSTLPRKAEMKGVALVLIASLGWGLATILVKIGVSSGGDSFTANALRVPAATFLLYTMALSSGERGKGIAGKLSLRNLGLLALTGILSYGLGSILFITAVEEVGAAKASILSSISPLFIVPLSLFFLRERLSWRRLVGIPLSVIGVILIVR